CGEASAEGPESTEGEGIIQDQRLVLLTDLGMLVKTARDGRQGVFVMSFRSGLPVAGAQVSLLGMNGVALASGKTDALGYAELPSVEGLKEEKTPSVYLVEKDNDLSFLPYSRKNRLLDISRFDIDGLKDAADSLHAYLFSDRGIYRPGDNIHIGLILRKRDWSALPSGLPLKAVITDPEDQEVWSQTLAFGGEGFEEIAWASPGAGKTGTYRVELFLAEKTDPSNQSNPSGKAEKKSLGSTTIRVEEFQPDRLQVKTEILGAKPTGWLNPEASKAKVTVRNLFGTPAAGNPAKLEMTVRPWSGQVPGYSEYRFRGSIATDIPHLPQDLGEAVTDPQGEAQFDLPLAGIDEPVFEITLAGEGFEKGTGRSVVSVASSLVSRHPFLLGYAADGSLDYIAKGSLRSLKLQALGPDFKPKDAGTIAAEIYEKRYVSTLVKREDGLYAYQSSERDEPRKTLSLALAEGKAGLNLPTENPGRFFVVFKNAQGVELNRAAYSVAGEGNVSRNIERNTELNLSLNKKEYQPGEEIELQIVAPYQGAGLITIEQDGVIASQWFKTASTSSTHRIALPKGASGNAYLSVAFVRSLDSQEIYMSPLSYGVASFAISRQAFSNELTLNVPETVQPGTHLDVHYRLKEASKLVLYAVDEGILQFAHYRDPAPLDFFFRKRALQTKTHQILDLILPDYALVQKLSASGGDEDAETFGKYKNPFARKHKPPMAFWSGILEAAPGEHVLSIPVPDYFNGAIRVLAVAANAGKLAAPVARTVARNPFVIQPQQPLVVAPGDEFDLGVLVANTTSERGELAVSVAADEALELRSANPQMLNLAPGEDGIVRFKAKARAKLGPVKVNYQVTGGGRETGYGEEMSIRPTQPLLTTSQNGVLRIEEQRTGKSQSLDFQREVYDEQRYAEIAVSMTPTAYLRGIVEYLKNYPYGCTEQLSSQAFPAVVLGANQELGLSSEDAHRLFERVLKILQTRQKHDGSFGYWSVSGTTHPFYSLYATHLLLEARERGLKTSDAMFERAMHYADQYSQERHYSWPEHEAQAYGLYLLARNGQNIAERLRAFEAELARQWGQGGDSANRVRFFLGAAYKLHHLDQDADRFFGEFQRQWKKTGILPWNIQNSPETMSLYLYLVNKHSPELVDTQDPQFGRYLLELAQDLVKQRTNSFRGSLALLGLGSLWDRFDREEGKSFNIVAGKPPAPLLLQGKTVKRAALEKAMRPVEVRGDGVWNLYYQLTERGYDKAPPAKVISQGLSISRSLLNEKGEKIGELDLQDKLHIRFSLHPDRPMKDLAVVMLIPGGFEIDLGEEGLASRQSLAIADKPLWQPEYIDVQEDRVVLFGDLEGGEKFFEFRLKPLNAGTYTVPPVFAEGMYDTDIQYRGLAESIRVKE
ncbi:MAG: MG2 domain-containing protein, partial [Methylococcaceae bacterium]|nr:MG2 domain-containing protein [Methylococcaceae bacterium]